MGGTATILNKISIYIEWYERFRMVGSLPIASEDTRVLFPVDLLV